MNAAGRVPCRCGVTLVLEPPAERRTPAPGSAAADILALGYTVSIERVRGIFDDLRHDLRGALGLEGAGPGVPDPGRAASPSLLWPALGLAFEPGRFLPAAMLLLAALSLRWLPLASLRLAGVVRPLVATLATGLAAAVAITCSAAATHEMIAEGGRLSPWECLRALGRRPVLLVGACRDTGLRVTVAALLATTVALLGGLETAGGGAAAVSRLTAPVQVLLVIAGLGLAVGAAHRLLAYAALAPQARGLLMVQAQLEVKRISAERELVPARALAPALGGALLLAGALGGAVALVMTVWDGVAGAASFLHPASRAVGRDLAWALAGGVWCGYVGIAGLLAGYALGTGVSHEPVRAPEIITGTWGAGPRGPLKPIRDEDLDLDLPHDRDD